MVLKYSGIIILLQPLLIAFLVLASVVAIVVSPFYFLYKIIEFLGNKIKRRKPEIEEINIVDSYRDAYNSCLNFSNNDN